MEFKLKPVPGIDGLSINYDGSVIKYKDKYKTIRYHKPRKKRYKIINLKNTSFGVAKLVYRAWVGELPPSRQIIFFDKRHHNTHYRNLGPRPATLKKLTPLRKVPSYDDLWINNNGTIVEQYGLEVNITECKIKEAPYRVATISTPTGSKSKYIHRLVALAFLNARPNDKVIHINKNVKSNHFNNLHVMKPAEYKAYNRKMLEEHRVIRGSDSIPEVDIAEVKRRLWNGATLAMIAKDYNCSDMSVSRFKKRHFSKEQIKKMNKRNGVVVKKLKKEIKDQIINELKKGTRQIDVSREFDVTPQAICRIYKKYIKDVETPISATDT